jgi:ankyrin repeat protein
MMKPPAALTQSAADDLLSKYTQLLFNPKTTYQDIKNWLIAHTAAVENVMLLHLTVAAKRADLILLLRSLKADFNAADDQGRTVLHHAATDPNRLIVLDMLVEFEAEQRPDEQGHTPLHLAILANHADAIRCLLRARNANIGDLFSHDNQPRQSIIALALRAKQEAEEQPQALDALRTLLECYRLPNVPLLPRHDVIALVKDTALPLEIRQKAYLYLAADADVNCLRECASLINKHYQDEWGVTAVMVAIKSGRLDNLKWLLLDSPLALAEQKVKLEGVPGDIYFYACAYAAYGGQTELLRLLTGARNSGGSGLPLNVESMHEYVSVGSAALIGAQDILYRQLFQAVADGGFGLEKQNIQDILISLLIRGDSFEPAFLCRFFTQEEVDSFLEKLCGLYGNKLEPVLRLIFALNRPAILHRFFAPKPEGLSIMMLNVPDTEILSIYPYMCIVTAIAAGNVPMLRTLFRSKLEGGFDFSFATHQVKELVDRSAWVATAIQHGHIPVLHLLTEVSPEGLGLPVDDVKDSGGRTSPLIAIAHGQKAMLHELVKPKSQGGHFGLSFNVPPSVRVETMDYDPILHAAKVHDVCQEATMIEALLMPVDQGGFGLSLASENIPMYLKMAIRESTHADFYICLAYFNQLIAQQQLEPACLWLEKNLPVERINYDEWEYERSRLFKRLKELLTSIPLAQCSVIINLFNYYAPGRVHLFLGQHYNELHEFVESFRQLQRCYSEKDCDQQLRLESGLQLAEMIYLGHVVLNADGFLNEAQTKLIEQQAEKHVAQQEPIPLLQTPQLQRVIYAYEYVYNSSLAGAQVLADRIEKIFAGQLTVQIGTEQRRSLLAPAAIAAYYQYYAKKNRDLIFAPIFVATMANFAMVAQTEQPIVATASVAAVSSSSSANDLDRVGVFATTTTELRPPAAAPTAVESTETDCKAIQATNP